jgi:cAMP-dependent protein kinase regulator
MSGLREGAAFLDRIELFNKVDKYDMLKLFDMLATKVVPPGEYVFREGDPGDLFYMIEQGQVECLKNGGGDTFGQETLVRTLYEGDHFGELALLTPGGKRYLSVRVGGDKPCVLLYLERTDFQKIVGKISKYLKMNYGGEFD